MIFGPTLTSPHLAVSRNRKPHAGDAGLVHQIDDELQFVEALEVGHLGGIASFHQRLESSLNER